MTTLSARAGHRARPPFTALHRFVCQSFLFLVGYHRVVCGGMNILNLALATYLVLLPHPVKDFAAAEVWSVSTTGAPGQPTIASHAPVKPPQFPADDRDQPLDFLRLRISRCPAARRKGPRSKAEIERERRERWERTCSEVDEVYAEYLNKFPRDKATATGIVYARFSTRFQDSIADQVRSILEDALHQNILVPRDLIFYDMAVRGFKKNRAGLEQVEAALRKKRASVLLLFSTSRLFRKQYRTLEFVDRIHKGLGIRCVFVKSGVDTNDKNRWETILATQAMIDQFVVAMNIANVQAAHEGLLAKQLVFGTLSFGYIGVPIEGSLTKLGRPRRRIEVDPVTSEFVRNIFRWYVEEELSINQIVQRLNADPEIPLSSGAISGQWCRRSVARLLRNSRYRGLWKYGVVESIYVPDADYMRQRMRAEPLKEIYLEALRIVTDDLWYAAQRRLAKRSANAGRPAKDGDRRTRPKVLNDLLVCPGHGRLHVSGSYGRYMQCPVCDRLPAEERELFSSLDRALALKLVCAKLAELVHGDSQLVEDSLAACGLEIEAAHRPDPARLAQLRVQLDKLKRSIDLTRRTAGETPEDQAEAEASIRAQQRERAGIAANVYQLEAALARVPKKPSDDDARRTIAEMASILLAATEGDDAINTATVRQIIDLLTGGKIELYQMGERLPQRGWLQGRFEVRLLPYLVEKLTGVPPVYVNGAIQVTIDFIRPLEIEDQAERAWQLAMIDNWLNREIAAELGCCMSYVTKLLKHAARKHGQPFVDGRARRSQRARKHVDPPLYQKVADEVVRRSSSEKLGDIAKSLGVCDDVITASIRWWHEVRGLPIPDGRTRRKGLADDTSCRDLPPDAGCIR